MEKEKRPLAPYIRTTRTTQAVMVEVVIALVPVMLGSIYFFGIRALWMNVTGVVTCVGVEYLWQKVLHKQVTVNDVSAVVTGILIACNMPVTTPLWVITFASIFAIVVGKQLFGGIGSNFANPALMGRLSIMLLWPATILQYELPRNSLLLKGEAIDAVSSATVLSLVRSGQSIPFQHWEMFLGDIPGAIGETGKLFILIGFVYLCYKGIITMSISVSYFVTVVLVSLLLGGTNILTSLLSGGLLLGGCFMLTDYAFATKGGKVLFGITAGVITAIIRVFGGYPEGVCFGILTANCLASFLAGFYKPHIYGVERKRKLGWKKVIGRE